MACSATLSLFALNQCLSLILQRDSSQPQDPCFHPAQHWSYSTGIEFWLFNRYSGNVNSDPLSGTLIVLSTEPSAPLYFAQVPPVLRVPGSAVSFRYHVHLHVHWSARIYTSGSGNLCDGFPGLLGCRGWGETPNIWAVGVNF